MAKFMFTGDPKGGTNPSPCLIFGGSFPLNVAVEVTDEVVIDELRRHSHFTEVADAPAPKASRGRPKKAR